MNKLIEWNHIKIRNSIKLNGKIYFLVSSNKDTGYNEKQAIENVNKYMYNVGDVH